MPGARPMPHHTPTPVNRRFVGLDYVRGAGALAVVLGHSYLGRPHGFWANLAGPGQGVVELFFGMSGFLLFRPYLVELAGGRAAPSIRAFLAARMLRLVPAYWVALTFTAVVFGSAFAPGALSSHWWVFYGFGQIYSAGDSFHGLPVAWSLCTELGFILALPGIVVATRWLARRMPWPRAAMVPVAGLLCIGPIIHMLNVTTLSPGLADVVQRLTYSFAGEANFFAEGMALAVATVSMTGPRPRSAALGALTSRPRLNWAMAAVVMLAAANFTSFAEPAAVPFVGVLGIQVRFVGSDLLISLSVLLILIPAVFDHHLATRPEHPLVARGLVHVALVSYGLYLWHLPLLDWLTTRQPLVGLWSLPIELAWPLAFIVATSLGLAVATLSWRLMEDPLLRLKPRRRARAADAPSAVLAPVGGAG